MITNDPNDQSPTTDALPSETPAPPMRNEIRQYRPSFFEGFGNETVAFDTVEQLVEIPWVKNFATDKDFHQFSMSDKSLMAEYDGGKRWMVCGTLKNPVEGLLKWEPGLPETLAPPPSIIALQDAYHGALIGHTVSPAAGPRYAYSLNMLARMKSRELNVSIERAREVVWEMVGDVIRMHGDRAPLFVDDAVSRPELVNEKSRIIVPGRYQ